MSIQILTTCEIGLIKQLKNDFVSLFLSTLKIDNNLFNKRSTYIILDEIKSFLS